MEAVKLSSLEIMKTFKLLICVALMLCLLSCDSRGIYHEVLYKQNGIIKKATFEGMIAIVPKEMSPYNKTYFYVELGNRDCPNITYQCRDCTVLEIRRVDKKK